MTAQDRTKKELDNLITYFKRNEKALEKGDSNEEEVIFHYISPMFKALGWDFNNEKRNDLHKLEVRTQRTFKSNNRDYRPDFNFNYSNGIPAFYLDAKAVPVKLKTHSKSAFQVRQYGWNDDKPVCVLTDFQEFAVYNCTLEPKLTDSADIGLIKYFTYDQYLNKENFDFLWSYFYKPNVHQDSLKQLIKTEGYIKGGITVDKHFLNSLNRWRELLAIGIKKSNSNIDEFTLNYLVQQTLDRILFLRICESRNIEQHLTLYNKIVGAKNAYENLVKYYLDSDNKYNSGLFDFKKDTVSTKIHIDNFTLATIIDEFYKPPYRFDVIPVEIIGNAYEQFLGNEIRIEGNKVVVEQKPEVRKAGGVYYTPQYIVNYIVEKTVGQLIKGKNPDQISKIKILDPSCGSGSFLLGVYQYLIDYHLDYYVKNQNRLKSVPIGLDGKLTTTEKKRILNNNIFGVDLDERAVEIAKLSLLLKVLEDETSETLADERLLGFKEKVLPNLDMNIKCGNSLISSNFKTIIPSVTQAEIEQVKPFDWLIMFPQVFKQGGFDAVVGNPPYGAELSPSSQSYMAQKYPIGNTDTAALFIVKTQQDLLKKGGFNGFIVPKSFTYASNWEKTRNILIDDISTIVDCSKVWKQVKLEMTIYISQKDNNRKDFTSFIRQDEAIVEVGQIQKKLCQEFGFILNGVSADEVKIGQKIKNCSKSLNDFIINQRGAMLQKEVGTTGDYFVLGGKQVQRYRIADDAKGKIKKVFVNDSKAFIKDDSIFVQRIVSHVMNPTPRVIITAALTESLNKNKFVIVDTINQLQNKSKFNSKFIIAILNSTLISWYAYRFIFANAIRTMQFDNPTTEKIPFPNIDLKIKADKTAHENVVKHIETILQLKNELANTENIRDIERIEKKCDYTQDLIDDIVYQIYGLTKAEIEIIENS